MRHLFYLLRAWLWLAGVLAFAGCGNLSPAIEATTYPAITARAISAPTTAAPPSVGAALAKTGPAPTATPVLAQPSTSPRPLARTVPWQSYIRKVTLATGTRGEGLEPLGETLTYPVTQHEFHCVVSVQEAPGGTQLRAQWYNHHVEGVPENSIIDDAYATIEGSGNLDFTLFSRVDWVPGEYRVQISAENELVQVIVFTVHR